LRKWGWGILLILQNFWVSQELQLGCNFGDSEREREKHRQTHRQEDFVCWANWKTGFSTKPSNSKKTCSTALLTSLCCTGKKTHYYHTAHDILHNNPVKNTYFFTRDLWVVVHIFIIVGYNFNSLFTFQTHSVGAVLDSSRCFLWVLPLMRPSCFLTVLSWQLTINARLFVVLLFQNLTSSYAIGGSVHIENILCQFCHVN
jgi:hypothetical protein